MFDSRSASVHAAHGPRPILVAVLLEVVRLVATASRPGPPLWLLLPLLAGLALLAIVLVARLQPSEIGLIRWRDWSTPEKSYFVQIIVIAVVVFLGVLGPSLARRVSENGAALTLLTVFVPYLFYGFYQELVYRGLLQREFVRRWGPPVGVIAANLLYTFGPLHLQYYAQPMSLAAGLIAATFAIGLFFGLVYLRSGNLWLAGIFHAIGNAFIVSSGGLAR
jgi:membrane protease YdiL (CAAX protease family)